ncbi:MAG TPA: hypothetical protein VHP54_04825 [Caproiciproducens sp.]|nr:hypothetical protein [Caproiciproducens sp.]
MSKKRIICLMCSILLVVSCFVYASAQAGYVHVLADFNGTASKDFGMKLSANENVDAGSSFTVDHTFTNLSTLSKPVYALQFNMNYNAQAMTFHSVQLKDGLNGTVTYNEAQPGQIIILYDSKDSSGIPSSAIGLLSAQFKVKEGQSGNYSITMSDASVLDEQENKIDCSLTNASVKVGKQTNKKITGMSIYTQPVKTNYLVGEKLDLKGLSVKVEYSDKSSAIFANNEFNTNNITVVPKDGAVLKETDTQIIISTGSFAAKQAITVSASSSNSSSSGSSSSKSDSSKEEDKNKHQSETVVTENGGSALVIPSAKPSTVENGKAVVDTEISDTAVFSSASVENATAQNPAKLNITIPASDAVASLQGASVAKLQLNVKIPASIINSDKISIDTIKVDKAVLEAAKQTSKDIIVSVQKDNNTELYAVILSGKALQTKAVSEADTNFAARVQSTNGVTAVSFKESRPLPGGTALRVSGFAQNKVYYVYSLNPKTGYADPVAANHIYKADVYGNIVFPISGLSNYEVCSSRPSNAYPVISDTTTTVRVKNSATYTFKMTASKNAVPKFTLGNGKSFSISSVKKGSDYYVTVSPLGRSGDTTGVYCTLPNGNAVALGSAIIK